MNCRKALSIIIPCYNCEEYISKCLNSIEKQVDNIEYEILIIDDKSTDGTLTEIKKELKRKVLNIKLIENSTNMGAGASRNKAIKVAKYDYIAFVDADDYLDDNYFESMLDKIYRDKSDVVVCDTKIISMDGTSTIKSICEGELNNLNVINSSLAASPWAKIIKKELLLKYPFAEGIMNEDVVGILSILANTKKISYVDDVKYNYIQHISSVQNSKLSQKRLDLFKAVDMLENNLKDMDNYKEIMQVVYYQQFIPFLLYVICSEKSFSTRYKYLKIYNKNTKKYNLKSNPYFLKFLNDSKKKARIYYKILMTLNDKQLSFCANILISTLQAFKKIKRSKLFIKFKSVIKQNITIDDLIYEAQKQQSKQNTKSISVVIPNYNYANYLYERVYSILSQTYKINELIILDDKSTDNSFEVIESIRNAIGKYVSLKVIYNEKNSGSPFIQWEKGFQLASSEYIWIAEADDYCDKDMIENLMIPISQNDDVVLSYCDTSFINKFGVKINKSIKKDIDIMETHHWDSDYIIDGKEEIKNYSFLNCTIANVSSVVFKKDDYTKLFEKAKKYSQVGDWQFYLGVFEKGKVAYVNKVCNYYRDHGDNVTSVTKKQKHLNEIKQIHEKLRKVYKFSEEQEKFIENRYEFLSNVWKLK